MKNKFGFFLFFLLLTACQNSYEPDHSLKQAWTNELENTQPSQIPYGLVYETGSKKLIYVAVHSAFSPAKGRALIESLIKTQKPQIILCQGHTEERVSPTAVKFKIDNPHVILTGASAPRKKIIDHLALYGVSERDYEIYSLVTLINQQWQFEINSPKDLNAKIVHYLKTTPHAKRFHLTFEDVQTWFYEKTGHPMTIEALFEGLLVAPQDPHLASTTYLQKISFYQDEIDDAVAMSALGKALENYDTVMIIRASSKYVTERAILHKMLGVSEPTKIVN
ncbi:MAG: hypothetical protein K2Y08_02820 [Alphaproteobacteria bacterium]|nr:hypothetical protein [Alphaproteobacteria bacterium]